MSDSISDYIVSLFAREDDVLLSLREAADREGLPPIAVPPETGRFLQLLLRAVRARRVLEVGTLGGYSAIWIARAIGEEGRVLSIEMEPRHAEFARRQLERAGLTERVEIRLGRAVELLPALDGERFDAVFLDADKDSLPTYLDWAVRLLRPGGLVIADNTLWGGRVLDPSADDSATRAVREFNRRLAEHPKLTSLLVPIGDGVGVGVVS